MKNKKAVGLGARTIVMIIIIAVSFGIALFFSKVVFAKAAGKGDDLACRQSVALRAQITLADMNLGPLQCKTKDLEISGTRNELKAQLARMMARCWWMFNEARQDDALTPASFGEFLKGIFGLRDARCFLCYTAEINEEKIEDGAITEKEMLQYLLTRDYYKIKGMKYINYIQSYGGSGHVAIQDSVKPLNSYGIVFLSKTTDEPADIESTENFYTEERAVSMIIFDNLKSVEEGGCLVRDLGES